MRRLFQIIAFVSLIMGWPVLAPAQSVRTDSTDAVMKQLLSAPAPTPRTGEAVREAEGPLPHPARFYEKEKMPPDDAPIRDLIDYWMMWASNIPHPDPSPVVVGRLLEESGGYPDLLANLLTVFRPEETTANRVKEFYDRGLADPQADRESLQKIRKWLLYNSKFFNNELVTLANKVRDNEKGYIDQQEALVSLAKLDWPSAEPLVQSLMNSSQPRSSILALTLLYDHAVTDKDLDTEDKLRVRLQTIAADRSALMFNRSAAIDCLSLSEWSGRDDWYLSLFHDETLLENLESMYSFPLGTMFLKDPDKWIPVLAKMTESPDRTVRSTAASCLILYQNNAKRAEAMRPLLPWLSNPDWVKDAFNVRLRLIQSMQSVNLPESVPGLIWVVEHDTTDFSAESGFAAQALSRYKDIRAVPALKKALATTKYEVGRRLILEGLFGCGGLLESEQVEGLEAYAALLAVLGDRNGIGRTRTPDEELPPMAVSIGIFMSHTSREVPDGVLHAVLARADVLKKTDPAVAKALLQIVHGWQGPQVELDIVRRLADGSADAAAIRNALERRATLRQNVKSELEALSGASDLAQGVAPVLLENASLAQSVLSSGSESSQIALLACARLEQFPLPVDVVGGMLQSKNQLLAEAAESYLLAEDSKQARELLWAHHPNEAFVTGWRESLGEVAGGDVGELAKFEEKLRTELFKENQPVETIALITNNLNNGRVLRVYTDRAVYTHYENAARYRERVITKEELTALRDLITTNDFANVGPQLTACRYDCQMSELLLINKEKGRRMFTHEGFLGEQKTLLANFDRLDQGDNAKIHYNLEKEIKGLEVLYSDEQLIVRDVWQGETGLRIFVEEKKAKEEVEEAFEADDSEVEEDEAMIAERRRQEMAKEKARFSWRALASGKTGAILPAPAGFSSFDESRFPDEEEWFEGSRREAQFVAPDSLIIAQNYDGLWRQVAGRKPVKISEDGAYSNPIVTPDGKWIVVGKTGSWDEPRFLVRFNLQTGREFRFNLPEAQNFAPLAYVAPHGRVLVRRARNDSESPFKPVGPEKPEYYLVDAATGRSELVTGVFEPLQQNGERFLQPTGKPNEVWAAISNAGTNETRVGRYNLKDFSFQQVLLVPHITFDSKSMWVDASAGKLFIVYEGQLVSLPLPRAPEDATTPKKAGSVQPN